MGALTGLFFIAVLWGDTIAGYIYLNHLCTAQGGSHVYQTVELGPEYWNEDGSAKFIYPKRTIINGKFVGGKFNDMFSKKFTSNSTSNKYLEYGIYKFEREVRNYENDLIAEYRFYLYKGGWLDNSIGYETTASNCGKTDLNYPINFYKTIFLNKNK